MSRRADRWLPAGAGVVLAGYFLWFWRSALNVQFAVDEPMNMATAWRLPVWKLVLAPFMPWQPFYRPLAGWLFVPFLDIFGLNPLPIHATMLLVVFLCALLVYRLARLLDAGRRASWLAALICCCHPGLRDIYYNTAFIYDALCCLFYLLALTYYLAIRRKGLIPTWRQIFVFFLLYLLALDAKEMAVTLPVVILLYELIYQAVPLWPAGMLAWVRGPGRTLAVGVCLNLVYLWGRVFRENAIVHNPAYVPKISAGRFWDFQVRSFSDLFENWQWFTVGHVIEVWVILLAIAWRTKRPVLWFAYLFLLSTPLPIEFIVGRAGAELFIPLAGWAIFVSVAFVILADDIGGFLAGTIKSPRLSAESLSVPILAVGLFFWVANNVQMKRERIDPAMVDIAPRTSSTIRQLLSLHPHVRSGATVVFLDDPMGTYDMAHIADLYFHDRTVRVLLNRQTPLSSDQVAKADCLIDYRGGRFIRLR